MKSSTSIRPSIPKNGCVKSKGLVVVGIILIVASLLWAMAFFVFQEVSLKFGPIEVSGIESKDAIDIFIFVALFFGGLGLVVKGFI